MNHLIERIDSYFGVTAAGSTVRRELAGGATTFATMSYIVFVQPTILSSTGMPFGSVLLATCLSAAFATALMGFVARYPFAQAPGMGENFLFAFTVCGATAMGGMGFSWQAGLAIVLIAGLIFLALTLFGVREKLMTILPPCLRHSIGPAIGFFIAFVGLQWGGIVVINPATMVALGDLTRAAPLITLGGVALIAALMARGVRGAILAGIVFAAGAGLITGVIPFVYEPVDYSFGTFFALDFMSLIENWPTALVAIALFFFLDLFDTVGTLVGLSSKAGYLREDGQLPRAGQAFFCDAAGTCAGAVMGTSTVTTYIESATGIAAGARTGLAAVMTSLCFLATIALAPIVRICGQDVGPAFYEGVEGVYVSMYPAVAPALIVVGCLMFAPLRRVDWDDITDALPAFLTIALMALGYGITEGIAAGCISFAVIKPLAGRPREVHPVMYGIAVALALRYAFLT